MKVISFSIFTGLICLGLNAFSQKPERNQDPEVIRKIYDMALTEGSCYENLRDLCYDIGARLSGSPEAAKAVVWAKSLLEGMGLDSVYLQEVMVPHWVRGDKEEAFYKTSDKKKIELPVTALGGSIGTKRRGITEQVIEVRSFEELKHIGSGKIKGKIVFYNRPMEPRNFDTFDSYSGCNDQRVSGAAEAAPYGAKAVIVRSMTLRNDEFPHTGVMSYADGVDKIPAAAISTASADALSTALKQDPDLEFTLKLSCENLPDVLSHNVIGELKGSKYPDQYILVGGHLDSWDVGQGAHDDGAGVVQSIEVLHLLRQAWLRPEHSIRCVLFMNEENGSRGALRYANSTKEKYEQHIYAIESDRGGFTPRGFTVDGLEGVKEPLLELVRSWRPLLEPYGLHYFEAGYSGVDINKLKEQGTGLLGFVPDSQRYFDHHHAHSDTFDAVNKRELELGAASMASLVYLLSKYGGENGIGLK